MQLKMFCFCGEYAVIQYLPYSIMSRQFNGDTPNMLSVSKHVNRVIKAHFQILLTYIDLVYLNVMSLYSMCKIDFRESQN